MSRRQATAASFALGLMLVQFAAIRLSPVSLPVRIALPATIALVPVALWPMRHYAGVWVMFVGLAANLAVILANGGLMPIERQTVVRGVGEERAAGYQPGRWIAGSKDVLLRPGAGRAVALGDGIIVRTGSGGFAASPGDFVVWAGVALLAGEAAVAAHTGRRRSARAEGANEGAAEGSATTPR